MDKARYLTLFRSMARAIKPGWILRRFHLDGNGRLDWTFDEYARDDARGNIKFFSHVLERAIRSEHMADEVIVLFHRNHEQIPVDCRLDPDMLRRFTQWASSVDRDRMNRVVIPGMPPKGGRMWNVAPVSADAHGIGVEDVLVKMGEKFTAFVLVGGNVDGFGPTEDLNWMARSQLDDAFLRDAMSGVVVIRDWSEHECEEDPFGHGNQLACSLGEGAGMDLSDDVDDEGLSEKWKEQAKEQTLYAKQDIPGAHKAWFSELEALGADPESASLALSALVGISSDEVEVAYKRRVLQLPWSRREAFEDDLTMVKAVLDTRLYGLHACKEEILKAIVGSMLSDRKLMAPTRLLLYGSPGTGKTAMARAIAEALRLPFQRIAMNTIGDMPAIVGCETMYRAPKIGKIMECMIAAKAKNPVILLDEIEKCGRHGNNGNPLDALHQVLDPDENRHFTDAFFGFPFDLGEVTFVATCNDLDALPPSILDRLTVIHVPEYTLADKLAILPYLLGQIQKDHALPVCPVIEHSAMDRLQTFMQAHSLRQIKALIWDMICHAALDAPDLGEFKENIVITEACAQQALRKRTAVASRPSLGFV